MGHFDSMLGADESLFRMAAALDYDHQPKMVPYRENEQQQIALCIKPLLAGRNGRNAILYGRPGVGKTVAIKHILAELEEETDDVSAIYINCWQKTSSYKAMLDICEAIGFKFTQNKRTDELFQIVAKIVNKGAGVFVLDEVDKLEDLDLLYWILEGVYKKSIILITNFENWVANLDSRIKSRLVPESIQFKPYNAVETKGILEQRKDIAFVPGVWKPDAFDLVVAKAHTLQDIRTGLYLMRESGQTAEDASSKTITDTHVNTAIAKLPDFTSKDPEGLNDDNQFILQLVSELGEVKIGDLFREYEKRGGKSAYKTFQRRVATLEKGSFVATKKLTGGAEGTTTLVRKANKGLD
ncbi:hypothetical protein COY28_05710, partial [Candidatus Woesearchaeota archaeon CG_4_10_14_0_2_um_filter_57_5]